MTIARETLPLNFLRSRSSDQNPDVAKASTTYIDRFGANATADDRKKDATSMVNEYYDIVTDLYEYGWGQAFHFAPRYAGETFYQSLSRHEHFLALHGGFKAGTKILDIGCGVGGPLRNMVRFTGAEVTGVNNNAYQISRAKRHDERVGLGGLTRYLQCDFNSIPVPDASYDGAYAIEATCHAADKTRCYGEIFRTLKPGAFFCGYEWIVTDKYDASNPVHRRIKHQIEKGNALPDLETAAAVVTALKNAGFEVVASFDVIERFESSPAKQLPWYHPLTASYTSLDGFKATPIGRWCTGVMLSVFEFVRLAPKGTQHATEVLQEAAVGLVDGGKHKVFTPAYFFAARKPLTA